MRTIHKNRMSAMFEEKTFGSQTNFFAFVVSMAMDCTQIVRTGALNHAIRFQDGEKGGRALCMMQLICNSGIEGAYHIKKSKLCAITIGY